MMSGKRHIRGEEDLTKTYKDISESKLRIWLLRSLMSRNLSTRDIYSFIRHKAELRSIVKSLDMRTMTEAMRTKSKDIKLLLADQYDRRRKLEERIRLRSGQLALTLMKRKRRELRLNAHVEKKKIKYEIKIEHYLKCQTFTKHQQRNLSIFGRPKDLPRPVPPTGPYICEQKLEFSKDELQILNKDPKFSICKPLSKIKFLTEVERMSSKHRYRRNIKQKEEKENKLSQHLKTISTPVNTGEKNWYGLVVDDTEKEETDDPDPKNAGAQAKALKEEQRQARISELWNETKERYTYNPTT